VTPRRIQLVQDNFAMILPRRDEVARSFYDNLFVIDPSLRSMFPADLSDQGRKLMQVLAVVVRSLDNLLPLLPSIDDMARRHVAYGVLDHHYAVVGQALIRTLQDGLGTAFTQEMEEAWREAYGILSSRMITATKPRELLAA
jgi:hemoglobin-like flavoprotein